jgi:hypothetical protein
MFILPASVQKLSVQRRQIVGFRYRDPMVSPKISGFSFHATLLMRLRRRAKLRLKSPVRAEGDEPRRLFPAVSPQDFLYRRTQIVITQLSKHSAKVGEARSCASRNACCVACR